MSSALNDLLVTDAELDQIANREFELSDDLVLTGLASLAQLIDEEELPSGPPMPMTPTAFERQQISHPHRGGFALVATVALVLSSSGVAAAMTGDALAPFHYVARHVLELGTRGSAQTPGWDLDGSGPIGTFRMHGVEQGRALRGEAARSTTSSSHQAAGWLSYIGHTRYEGGPPKQPSSLNGTTRTSHGQRDHGRPPETPGVPGRSEAAAPVSPIRPPVTRRHGHAGSTGALTHVQEPQSGRLIVALPVRSHAVHPFVLTSGAPVVALPSAPTVASPTTGP